MIDVRSTVRAVLVAAAVAAVHPAVSAPMVHKVGAVTRHAAQFINQDVVVRGYLLARADGYVLFSDEARGRIGRYDLPVTGNGIDEIVPHKRYLIEGTFLDHGLTPNNGNPDHLELTVPPQLAGP